MENAILTLADVGEAAVRRLLGALGMTLVVERVGAAIPGSYWGEPEAGLIGDRLHARPDTPLHSILHEACHWVCMSPQRRATLHTDAGGDVHEENAVCYLQILLADRLEGYDSARCMRDMDAWGYSFRLGSARAWFERDAADARQWLAERGLLALADMRHETRTGTGADGR